VPTPVTGFRFPLGLLERMDAARGSESRTQWLIRLVEQELDRGESRSLVATGGVPDPPAVEFRAPGAFSRSLSSFDAKAGVIPR
jgi:hypothetical protein